ncbi:MAG: lipoyl protein ligase domain-containing protein [Candidatus Woesearchaeota archaeon]
MSLEKRIASWSDLGQLPYSKALDIQIKLSQKRQDEEIPDTILICQHDPIIHFSSNIKLNSFSQELIDDMRKEGYSSEISQDDVLRFLSHKGIDFGRNTRGGGGAYVGPGQLVIYPVVDYEKIVNTRFGVNEYKNVIDEIMKDTLVSYGIDAEIFRNSDYIDTPNDRDDRKDVWVMKEDKPYKLGGKTIITSNNIAYHGFCIYKDRRGIEGFRYVDPCGHTSDELGILSMEDLTKEKISHDDLREKVLNIIKKRFNYESLEKVGPDTLY